MAKSSATEQGDEHIRMLKAVINQPGPTREEIRERYIKAAIAAGESREAAAACWDANDAIRAELRRMEDALREMIIHERLSGKNIPPQQP